MGIWINGMKSEGPYGYLCSGLVYRWDENEKLLLLDKLVLTLIDTALRESIDMSLYSDMFERSTDLITEKNGKHYYNDCPILNYDFLSMPDKLDNVVETKNPFNCYKSFINTNGVTKYSVNRVCQTNNEAFSQFYCELYAWMIDWDFETLRGKIVGFDVLGKIIRRNVNLGGENSIMGVRKCLLKDMIIFDRYERDKEYQQRVNECGIMNFSCYTDKEGKIAYEYIPI